MMNSLSSRTILTAFMLCVVGSLAHRATGSEPEEGPVYELRIYTCEPGKLSALNERFRDFTMEIFARHGIENVAYWIPTQEPAANTTLIYLLRHKSRAAASKSWDDFRDDPQWQQIAKQWEEQYGKILAKAPEATYLVPTDYSPSIEMVTRDRLYELRIYTAAEGKLDALHDRFRQHSDKLLRKHGMKAFGYFQPMDEPKSKDVMIYFLEHKDLESAQASWAAFMADPDWQAVKKASETEGTLLAQRPEAIFMKPTEYSPTK